MTSAVSGGGGSQKRRRKEQNQLICDSDREGGKNPKSLRTSYMEAPLLDPNSTLNPKWPWAGHMASSVFPFIIPIRSCTVEDTGTHRTSGVIINMKQPRPSQLGTTSAFYAMLPVTQEDVSRADRKSQVRQCLGFCSADS